MRKALCVGIDYYQHFNGLGNCVSDAKSMEKVLSHHGDGSINFDVTHLHARRVVHREYVGKDPFSGDSLFRCWDEGDSISTGELRRAVEELFETDKHIDVALFYFAGHGYVDAHGGYLCTSELKDPKDGLDLDYLMRVVRNSKALNKIIILDSCHSGVVANLDPFGNYSFLPENTIIMSACTNNGTARDGCYTPLMVAGLEGAAMNLLGEVSPSSIHSFIDRALGARDQRPVLKANIENSVCLRKNPPLLKIETLREITSIFAESDTVLPLDPGYEEDKRPVDENYLELAEHDLEKERIMKVLRTYCSLNLVVPEGADYMYWAALKSQGCRLTPLGKYFWKLVNDKRI